MISIICGRGVFTDADNAGTLGYVFEREGSQYGLSASHVIGNYNQSPRGSNVKYKGLGNSIICGKVLSFAQLFDGPVCFDGGIFKLQPEITHVRYQEGFEPSNRFIIDPQPGLRVKHFGRETEGRFGEIIEVNASRTIDSHGGISLEDMLIVEGETGMFSGFGDSGSLVLSDDNRIIGLVTGVVDGFTLVSKIKYLHALTKDL